MAGFPLDTVQAPDSVYCFASYPLGGLVSYPFDRAALNQACPDA